MKFGQLINYKKTNIFLEKSYTNCGRETFPRPFSKKIKSKTIKSLDRQSKLYDLLSFYAKMRAINIH